VLFLLKVLKKQLKLLEMEKKQTIYIFNIQEAKLCVFQLSSMKYFNLKLNVRDKLNKVSFNTWQETTFEVNEEFFNFSFKEKK